MILQEKAWVINPSYLSEQDKYHTPEEVVFADSRGKAKSELLSKLYDYDLKDYLGDDITFLNLRVKRDKYFDKYLVNGEIKSAWQIELDRQTKERNDEVDRMVKENPTGFAYIKKRGLYYRPNSCGYTEYLISAGVYPIQRAADIVKSCSIGDHMLLIPIDPKEHNEKLNKTINDIKSRLIQI